MFPEFDKTRLEFIVTPDLRELLHALILCDTHAMTGTISPATPMNVLDPLMLLTEKGGPCSQVFSILLEFILILV
jgi:hypothetical protein